MWRMPASVLLAAVLGSAVATAVYSSWLSVWHDGVLPSTPEDFRIALTVFMGASWFTIPGAFLLWGIEKVLSQRIGSDRTLDVAVVIFGAFVGAMILGGLSLTNAPLDFALLGGFYGVTTAVVFVLLERRLGAR